MITAHDFATIPLLSSFTESEREKLARKSGDTHLCAGDFLLCEGEHPYYWVLLDGQLSMHKNRLGRVEEMTSYGKYRPGDCFGEIPILLGSRTFICLKADTESRVARIEPNEFHRLIRDHEDFRVAVMALMTERLFRVRHFFEAAASTRVQIVASEYDAGCRNIRHFLTLNRIAFEWVDREGVICSLPPGMPDTTLECAVLVDGCHWIPQPATVRAVAEALGIRTHPSKEDYDVVIIGGGPAGLAASVYAASEGLSVLMVERVAVGGQAGSSSRIENYLGFPDGISGDDMSERALRQAERFGVEMVVAREVTSITRKQNGMYHCELDGGDSFNVKSIVLATGVNWRCVDAPGIDRLRNRGVIYGAAKADANSIIGKDTFIVGGGNSAGQAAVFFANYAKSVTLLVRGDALARTMSQYLIDQISHNPCIRVESQTQVTEAEGRSELEYITTVTTAGLTQRRKAEALFILIGATADTRWLPKEIQRDKDGFVCTGPNVTDFRHWNRPCHPYLLETNLPGFFCVGDVRHGSMKRISSAVGEGSMAIALVHQYLQVKDEALQETPVEGGAASISPTPVSML